MSSRYFSAFCLAMPGEAAPSRFGLTVPRAVGKAIVRNRLKRRMHSALRVHLDTLPESWAVVFNPRRTALEAPFEELCREIGRIFGRCKQS